ncbi:MAG TPA: acyltransferase family protein [Ilumatobacteraceae bacterium]|nr:acyltransferase family protein [Ilumatobacteraceae bacterium]
MMPEARPAHRPEAAAFRADIEGLRGIAVLAVALFHLRLASVSGGFVGVDVFFVISGFLITRQLSVSVESGHAQLPQFWARRLRRLAPLLVLTIAATLATALVVYSPLEWRRMAEDAGAATMYVPNIVFARRGTQYFQAAESPFLHLWSLGVEEQFYLIWPTVIAVTAAIARRRRLRVRMCLATVIGATTLLSFLVALVLTARGTPWSFFSPISRAWEFGLGALVAVIGADRQLPRHVSVLAGWAGGLAVVASSLWFDGYTPTPSWSTLVPTVGTAALLIGPTSSGRWTFARWVSIAPLRQLGQVSYAWYLLHWPAIVLAEAAFIEPSDWVRWAAAAGSLLGAHLITRWVEAPIRRHPTLAQPRVVYTLALGASLSLLVTCLGVTTWADSRLQDPFLAHLAEVRDSRSSAGSADCVDDEVAPGLVECVYGDRSSDTTVMLVGDSHAAQWAPAAEAAAQQLHLRLIVRSYGGCPAPQIFVRRTGFDDASTACLAFRERTFALIGAVKPAAVVVGGADFTSRLLNAPSGSPLTQKEAVDAFEAALADLVAIVRDTGGEVGLVLDNPTQETDPLECLARGSTVAHCSVSSAKALSKSGAFLDATRRVAAAKSLPLFDSFDLVCDDRVCPVAIGDLVVYSDLGHLSREFTLSTAPEFARFISDVLAQD